MAKFMSDLTKTLFAQKKDSNKVTSIGNTIITQSKCPECEYNSEEYDVDAYCTVCDGQEMFTPKEGEEISVESAYDRVLALLPEMTQADRQNLLHILQDEFGQAK
ncbi:MAG: hypothetical protein K9K64_14835 [Desulfohalobiaceae bacterium]|nr:hypothetical protein [Desulfohalobiaceae bacterium]